MCRITLAIAAIFVLGSNLAFARDDNSPRVAFLSFGTSPAAYSITEQAILAQLYQDGFLSDEEYASTTTRGHIEGENISLFSLDAGWEYDRLNLMVETALDQDANVLIAFTTPVAQAAVNATLDMDVPPAVIFASVYYPFAAGLADAPCIKPAHVTGSQIIPPYEQLVALIKTQQPEVQTIGAVFSSDQISGAAGSQAVVAIGAERGINVLEAAVTHPVDFIAAVDGLVSRGAEALVLTIDTITSRGLPAVVATANENLVPVYYPSLGGVSSGAMISAGYFRQTEQGLNAGRMLSAYLRGELDVAKTAIDSIGGDGVGVNLAVAAELGIDIEPDILERADVVIDPDGVSVSDRLQESLAEEEQFFTAPDRAALDSAYLESLRCTDEMIAEQQAALDSAGE